jgi:hypothetical protein
MRMVIVARGSSCKVLQVSNDYAPASDVGMWDTTHCCLTYL